MSTQKDIIAYSLYQYIASRTASLAFQNEMPEPSVRRVLSQLVKEKKAKFVKRDIFGTPGYVATRKGTAWAERRAS